MKIIEITSDLMMIKNKERSLIGHSYIEELPVATFNCITDDNVPRIVIIVLHGHPKRKRSRQRRDTKISIMSDFNPLLDQAKWDEYFDSYKKSDEPIFEEALEIYKNAKDIEIKVAKSFEWSGILYKPEWSSCYYDKRHGYFVWD